MAAIEDVTSLYAKYLSYVAPPFPLIIQDASAIIPLQNVNELFKGKGNLAPIRYPVIFAKPGQENSGIVYQLLNEPLVSATNGSKQIVLTNISRADGRKGSVKEDIYLRDYSVTIEGFIIGDDENSYPEAEIAEFIKWMEYPGALSVNCKILNTMGIDFLTITDWDCPAVEGEGYNVFKYIIKALSDEDFEKELLGE
jgi:hypothetical protein